MTVAGIPQPTRADESAKSSRWVARTGLSRLVRVLVWLIPVVLSVLVFIIAARVWPAAEIGVGVLAWWVMVAMVALVVLIFTDKVARRFLPLSMLLRLALVFPDQAPSRFGSALRYGTPRKLLSRNPPTSSGLMSLVQAISHHDRATRGHSERVRAYSQMVGQELKLDQKNMDRLAWASLLHDVGKLDVSAEILNKQGHPNDEEWDELRQHPARAPAYLVGFEHWMGDWGRAASEHHERWDGKGYPQGLVGESIHTAGRITSVADAYDVMTSVRSYKKPMPTALAREEIARNAGSQFDPNVVRAFLNVGIGKVDTKWGALAWLTQIPDMVSRAPAAGLVVAVAMGASMGLIDPGNARIVDPVAAAIGVEATATPTPESEPSTASDPTPSSTPTPSPTATPEAADAAAGSGDGGSGDGGGDGGGDGDGGSDGGGDGGSGDGATDDDDPDDAETSDPTPPPGLSAGTANSAAAPVSPVPPTPTSAPTPTPTVNPVFDLLGGVPTPEPTADPNALFVLPPQEPDTRPTVGREVPTATPVPTATVVPTPTATPAPTPTPVPTATPIPTATATPTATPTPTPTPVVVLAFDDSFDVTSNDETALNVAGNDNQTPPNAVDNTTIRFIVEPLHALQNPPGVTDPDGAGYRYGPHRGHFDYMSVPGYVGPDSFVYEICTFDGRCATASVSINVLPPA